MPLLKAPRKQPKSATIQIRVEENVKLKLEQYAEFIDSSPAYVVTEALKLLFKRDKEFKSWLGQHTNNHNLDQTRRLSHRDCQESMKVRNVQFGERKNPDSSRVHGLRVAIRSQSSASNRKSESANGAERAPPPIPTTQEYRGNPLRHSEQTPQGKKGQDTD